ncbi:MAG: hypothetical protein H5U04_03930 [Firmicutes bacterium]|nr:hypothetical protein [Bacillota bacterium]
MVLAEAGADGTRVARWEAGPDSDKAGINFERTWESPLLGKSTIWGLWVRGLDGDGDLEVMVTCTDNYLAPADYLHVFELR